MSDEEKEGAKKKSSKTTKQPEGIPNKGPDGPDWEGGLSTEPSQAAHYLDSGQTEAEDHTTKPKG